MKVIQNTYPHFPKCAHAEVGDQVHWEHKSSKGFQLIRDSDKARVFMTAPADMNGNLYSNGQPPVLTGIIAQVKSKGWVLEVEIPEEYPEDTRDDEEKYYPKPKGGKK